MKLADFVIKEPKRTCLLLFVLSVAFAMCFSALVCWGVIALHARTQFMNTNAALAATDALALQNALAKNDETEIKVYRELLRARCPQFLDKENLAKMERIVNVPEENLTALCTEIEIAAEDGTVSGAEWKRALDMLVIAETDSVILAESTEESQGQVTQKADPVQAAERYFGLQGIFHSADCGAYCQNVYVDFARPNDSVRMYACACTPQNCTVTEHEAIRKAQAYAAGQQVKNCRVLSVAKHDGIWWIELTNGVRAVKVGVRGDNGAVCFFLQRQE